MQPLVTAALVLMAISFIFGPLRSVTLGQRVFTGVLVGFLYALDIVYARLRHDIPFTGWAPLMVLVLVIGGVLMLMLGIIGEYVWRIYDEIRGEPNYIVRERHL